MSKKAYVVPGGIVYKSGPEPNFLQISDIVSHFDRGNENLIMSLKVPSSLYFLYRWDGPRPFDLGSNMADVSKDMEVWIGYEVPEKQSRPARGGLALVWSFDFCNHISRRTCNITFSDGRTMRVVLSQVSVDGSKLQPVYEDYLVKVHDPALIIMPANEDTVPIYRLQQVAIVQDDNCNSCAHYGGVNELTVELNVSDEIK